MHFQQLLSSCMLLSPSLRCDVGSHSDVLYSPGHTFRGHPLQHLLQERGIELIKGVGVGGHAVSSRLQG